MGILLGIVVAKRMELIKLSDVRKKAITFLFTDYYSNMHTNYLFNYRLVKNALYMYLHRQNSVKMLFNGVLLVFPLMPHIFPWFLRANKDKYLLDLVDSHSWFDAIVTTISHAIILLLFATFFYLASIYGHTPVLKTNLVLQFFSSPIFAPFSRLSFCMYLTHVPLTWFNVNSARTLQIRDEYGAVSLF